MATTTTTTVKPSPTAKPTAPVPTTPQSANAARDAQTLAAKQVANPTAPTMQTMAAPPTNPTAPIAPTPTTAATNTPAAPKPAAPLASINNQVQNAVELGGKDLNEILYLKRLYEGEGASKGQQSWAAGQAGQYYGNLDATTAAAVKNMNAQQLNDYIAGLGKTTTPTPTTPAASTTSPTTGYINQIRDLSAQNLNAQAYDARNQADALNLQNAQRMNELIANQGLTNSGENITAMGNLNAQRQGANTDINNQLSQNLNQLDINRANQLMDQYNIDADRAIQIAQMMGSYNGQQTLAGKQFDRGIVESDRNYNRGVLESDRNYNRGVLESDRNYGLDLGNMTGTFNGQRTLAGQNADLQRAAQMADLTGYYNGKPTFAREQYNSDNAYRNSSLSMRGSSGNTGFGGGVGGGTLSQSQLNSIADDLDSYYSTYDQKTGRQVRDKEGLERAIHAIPNLSDAQAEYLYNRFGLMGGSSGGSSGGFLSSLWDAFKGAIKK